MFNVGTFPDLSIHPVDTNINAIPIFVSNWGSSGGVRGDPLAHFRDLNYYKM